MTEKQKKKIEVDRLLAMCPFPEPFLQFYDENSEKLLDMKKEVLTKLNSGISYNEISNFYDILELYPDDNVKWD